VSDRRCPRVGEARVRRHSAVSVPNRLERLVGAFDAAVASGAGDDVKIRNTTARRMRLRESWERVRLSLRTSVRCSRRVRPRDRISSRLMFEDAFSSAIITVARAIAPLVAVFGNPPDDALESRCSSGATNCSGSRRSRILLQLLRANRVPPVLGRPIGLPLGRAGASGADDRFESAMASAPVAGCSGLLDDSPLYTHRNCARSPARYPNAFTLVKNKNQPRPPILGRVQSARRQPDGPSAAIQPRTP
jgi:hypothetical protein